MLPTYPSTPRTRFWRVAHYPPVTLGLGLTLVVAAGIALSFVLRQAGVPAQANQPGHWLALALQVAVTVLAYRLFNRFVERRGNVEFARAGAAAKLGGGLAGGFLLFSAVIAVIALAGGYRITGRDPAVAWAPILAVGFAAGIVEETIARGLIFRLIEQWLGSWTALAISAALFGAGHLANPHASWLAAAAIALEAGVMLGALYMLTRRLWAPIGLHAGWNMTQGGGYGVPVSGGAMHGLFMERTAGPDWLTGGAFGAEASLPAVVICTGVGVGLLLWCVRRERVVPWRPGRYRPAPH